MRNFADTATKEIMGDKLRRYPFGGLEIANTQSFNNDAITWTRTDVSCPRRDQPGVPCFQAGISLNRMNLRTIIISVTKI
jgi:hypothetical protein